MIFFRSLYPLLVFGLFHLGALAQCTPDLSYTNTGIYPKIIPAAIEGQAYDQVINFVFVKDTSVNDISVTFDTLIIDSITNLPPTISFAFNNSNQTYLGGDNGCARVTGMPSVGDAGVYPAEIHVTALFSLLGFPNSESTKDTIYFRIQSACAQTYADSSIGAHPNPLPEGFETTSYSNTVNLVFPLDTVVNLITLTIDSIDVLPFIGLPNGLSDSCYEQDCRYNQGVIACVEVKGVPAVGTLGDYDLKMPVTYHLSDTTTLNDTLDATLFINYPLGLGETLSDMPLIFPNPTQGVVNVSMSPPDLDHVVQVFSILGSKVIDATIVDQITRLDLSSFQDGIYLIQISDGNKQLVYQEKLIISK